MSHPPGRRPRRAVWLALLALFSPPVAWYATRFDPLGTARAAFDRRDLATALRLARAHLASWPADRRAMLMAARCLTRSGSIEEAERYYDRAGTLGPDDLHARAYSLIRAGRPDRAAGLYEGLLDRRPDDVLALQRLGAIRIGERDWRAVVEIAGRLVRLPSGEVAGRTMAGIAHHESRRYAMAASAFARVLELDPDLKAMPLPRALFWRNFATDLMAEGRVAEARDHLDRALADRKDALLLDLLGQAHQLEGRADRAEACWREAIDLDRDNVDALLDLGQLVLRRNDLPEAVALLTRAVELAPDQVEPNYRLGQALRASGELVPADRYARRAEEIRRSHPPTPAAAPARED